jgi:hypothetical protein
MSKVTGRDGSLFVIGYMLGRMNLRTEDLLNILQALL